MYNREQHEWPQGEKLNRCTIIPIVSHPCDDRLFNLAFLIFGAGKHILVLTCGWTTWSSHTDTLNCADFGLYWFYCMQYFVYKYSDKKQKSWNNQPFPVSSAKKHNQHDQQLKTFDLERVWYASKTPSGCCQTWIVLEACPRVWLCGVEKAEKASLQRWNPLTMARWSLLLEEMCWHVVAGFSAL